MPSIRLSGDVEAIAQTVSEQRGLGSTRTAIEAIVRCYWQDYLGGKRPSIEPADPSLAGGFADTARVASAAESVSTDFRFTEPIEL
ncbi:hypothetical protein H6F93_01490 [Leptolyngbya sp. FACHB-671]|uniref:hypothetical protein n=1 Tax=Leptolyngbya sp. FACHB-671 TaxID=2692812 RepID=UPI001686C456|nr:hypothetical protein [Leptolyngbya sp. FACHB-671]MBD2066212.1 hypothetical protein [Leptolyngbya sp. FACHB-671]